MASGRGKVVEVTRRRTIERILERHYKQLGQVQLIPVGDESFADKVTLVGADSRRGVLLVENPSPIARRHLAVAKKVKVQGVFDGLLTWFYATKYAEHQENGETYLKFPYPEVIERLQRRGAFRVELPANQPAFATFVSPGADKSMIKARIADISATGCAIAFRRGKDPNLPTGVMIEQLLVDIKGELSFSCDAFLRNRRAGDKGEALYGIEFIDLSAPKEQRLTKLIMKFQRGWLRFFSRD